MTTTMAVPRSHMPWTRVALLALLSLILSAALPVSASYPFQNASLPLAQRLTNLLSLLTLDEKVLLLFDSVAAVPRLNVSRFDYGQECLHGLIQRRKDLTRDGSSTSFPQSIGLASTFNRSVFTTMGRIISDEARAKRNLRIQTGDPNPLAPSYLICWTPVVNILKDPRWGRAGETYGESPLLTYQYTSSLLAALHGDDPKYIKIAPVIKHYTVYDGPEEGRHGFNAVVGARDLHDTYNFVYRHMIEEEPSHVRGLMASYSALNGVPVACDFSLLTETPRYEWGWTDGHIVSDCDAVTGIYEDHHYTADIASATALALVAGMDVNCGDAFKHLGEALQRGLIQPADVDVALSHAMTVQFRVGFYDDFGLSPHDAIDPAVVDSDEHRQAALEIGHQAMVLLKNSGPLLPLSPAKLRRVAVIGPSANDSAETLQCYDIDSGSCLLSHIYHVYPSFLIQPLEGIVAYLQSSAVDVVYARGCGRFDSNASGFAEAIKAAASADVVIYVGGLDYTVEEEDTDRDSLLLPDVQRQLLLALANTSTPIVTVLLHGGAISDGVVEDLSAAVLSAFYPGPWAGRALADVLFGVVEPSGRMPYTVYTNTSQLPPLTDYHMTDGPGRTYAFLAEEPRHYFGDGLGYTSWQYSGLQVTVTGDGLEVEVEVRNVGDRFGAETVQVYAAYDAAFAGLPASVASPALSVPRRFLLAFDKVAVRAQGSVSVRLTVPFTGLTAFGRWTQGEAADLGEVESPTVTATLTEAEVRAEIAWMRERREQLEASRVGGRVREGLANVTLPVWVSVGGKQPTAARIKRGEVLVQQVTVTAPIDDVPAGTAEVGQTLTRAARAQSKGQQSQAVRTEAE